MATAAKLLPDKARPILLVALLCVLALNAVMLYAVFTSRGQYVIWDFHPSWVASKAILQGADPYSQEVTEAIQALDYGRVARPGEDPQAFSYPIFVAYLLVPLAALPLPWAQAVWLTILEAAALAGLVLTWRSWRWPQSPAGQAALLLWTLSLYPLVWSFILGQWSIIIFALLAAGIYFLIQGFDLRSGATIGLSLIKPQITFLLIPGLLVWTLALKRWKFAAGLAVTLLLLGTPMLANPAWLGSFLNQLQAYSRYAPFPAPGLLVVERCCSSAANWLGPLLLAALTLSCLGAWVTAARSTDVPGLLWALGWTLIVSMLVAPRIATVNQVVLLFPLVGALRTLWSAGKWGVGAALALLLVCGIGYWILSLLPPIALAEPRYPVEHRVLSPILPGGLGLLWLAMRRCLIADSEFNRAQA